MTEETDVKAIDAVVNIWTDDALAVRPKSLRGFYVEKIGTDGKTPSLGWTQPGSRRPS
jgi:hypothetical protein